MMKIVRFGVASFALSLALPALAEFSWDYSTETGMLTEHRTDGQTPWVFTVSAAGSVTGIATQGVNTVIDFRSATMPGEAPVIKTWGFSTSGGKYDYLNKSASQIPQETVHFPEAITSFGFMHIYNWKSLKYITWPTNLTSIGQYAFEGNAIVDLVLPDTVTTIEGTAFNKSSNLQTIKMPAKLSSCGSSIFSNCGNIREITWPAWCGAWKGTSGNAPWSAKNCRYIVPGSNSNWVATLVDPAAVTLWQNVAAADQTAYYTRYGQDAQQPYGLSVSGMLPGGAKETWIVVQEPDPARAYLRINAPAPSNAGVELSPKPSADGSYTAGTTVTITFVPSNGVSIVGWTGNVPAGYETATSFSLTLAAGTTALGVTCIRDSYIYANNTLADGSVTLTVSGNRANGFTVTGITSCGTDGLVDLTKTIADGGKVIKVGGDAFKNNVNIKRVVLPDDLQEIGNNAFNGCNKLVSLEPSLPHGLTKLGSSTFRSCSSLTNGFEIGFGTNETTHAMIPLSITLSHSGDRNAGLFTYCSKIPYLKWGPAITEVPREGARGMSALTNIEFGINVQYVREFYDDGCNNIATISCLNTNTTTFTYKGRSQCFSSCVREIVWKGWYETRDTTSKLGSWADKNCRFIVPGDNLTWLNFIAENVDSWNQLDAETQQYYFTRYGADAKVPAGLSRAVAGRHNRTWIVKTEVPVTACLLVVSVPSAAFGAVTTEPAPRESDGMYAPGTDVTVTFVPSNGVTFTGWSGDVDPADINKLSFTFAITNTTTLSPKVLADFFVYEDSKLFDGVQQYAASGATNAISFGGIVATLPGKLVDLTKPVKGGVITRLASQCCDSSDKVIEMRLPDTITTFGDRTFDCNRIIKTVTPLFPRDMTYVGYSLFAGAYAFKGDVEVGFGTDANGKPIPVTFGYWDGINRSFLDATGVGPCVRLGSGITKAPTGFFSNSGSITNILIDCVTNMEASVFRQMGKCDITFTGDIPTCPSSPFALASGKNYLQRYYLPWRGKDDHPRWAAYLRDPAKVTPWGRLTAEQKALYRSKFPTAPRLAHPYGLTLVADILPANQWVFAPIRAGTALFLR